MNTFNLQLDLDKSTVVQVVTLRQGDIDGTTISATVYDHGELADLSGISSAYVEFALPDGTHYYRGSATVSGSVVTALVDESQAASVPGRACNAYFSLIDATTGNEYSTASFVVAVLASAVDGMELAESWDNEIQAAIQACWDAASGVTVADGSVTASKLANDSVTTPKLADGSVTLAKLASGVQIPQPTDTQVATSVSAWLDEHPEATTTVQDDSVTDAKLVQKGGVLERVSDFASLSKHDMLSGVTFEQGSLNPSTGADMTSATRIRCGYIALEDVESFTASVESGYQYIIDWFDSNKGTLYGFNNHGNWQTSQSTFYASDFGDAVYIRFLVATTNSANIQPSAAANLQVTYTDALTTVGELAKDSLIVNGASVEWEHGTIVNGEPQSGDARIRSAKIPMGEGSTITVSRVASGKQIIAHYYDVGDGSYLGQSANWTREPIVVPYNCDVIVLAANTSGTTISDAQMAEYEQAVTIYRIPIWQGTKQEEYLLCTSDGIYFEPIGTNGGMWCKFGYLYVRGSRHLDFPWSSVLASSHATSPSGVSDCLRIPHNQSLVLDTATNALALVATDSVNAYTQVPILSIGQAITSESVIGGIGYPMYVKWLASQSAGSVSVSKAPDFAALVSASAETEQFVYFTDPHLTGSANDTTAFLSTFGDYLKVIKAYADSTPTTFVMCGGDWLNMGDGVDSAKWKLGYAYGQCKQLGRFYGVVGNHDTNYLGADESGSTPTWPNESTSTLSNQIIANAMFGGEHANYYSFDGTHTRFYVFDSGTDWDSSMTAYRWAQIAWFANALGSDDKVHSAVSIHIWYTNYQDQTDDTISALATNIASVIAAYNARTSVTLNGITYNFASCTGHVEFVICGHTHFDKSGTSGSIPVVNTLNTRSGGTPSFDLVYVDYDVRKISTVRVGTGSDRTFSLATF